MSLEILYHDTDYIAVNKPSGQLVHPSSIDAHANPSVQEVLQAQIGHKPHPCHRLDKPTSGVLLFARTLNALRQAQSEFAQQAPKKDYYALVRGWPAATGYIDYPLRKELSPFTVQAAQTRYQCLAYYDYPQAVGRYPSARLAYLKLQPLTGRTHQLRRHLAHIRHPILGDTRHGDGHQNRFMRQHLGSHYLLLHAHSLELSLKPDAAPTSILAPMAPQFRASLQALAAYRSEGPVAR